MKIARQTENSPNRAQEIENVRKATLNLLRDLEGERSALIIEKAKDAALLESIGDGVVATDRNGATTIINKSATNMLGWRSEDVMGKKWHEIVRIEDEEGIPVPSAELPLLVALKIGATINTEPLYYFVRKDGTRFPAAITVTPIKLDDKIIGAVEVFRDITKEQELDRAKSEFISIASHQLRTPVAGLSWLTEALQFTSQNLDPKQKTYVEDLSMLSKRLIGLVEDLLNVSRIQLKTEVMTETSPIDFVGFTEEFIKEIGPYANSKKNTIVFNKNISKPIILEVNKKSLYNVLQNLVSNAIEYSPENTAVTINLEETDNFIKTSISNKGSVIPKNEQPNIFQRFYRAESAKKMKAEGTGLGLYIIKTIIEGMGGKVGFESEEGRDTTFWFTIPLETVTMNKDKPNN